MCKKYCNRCKILKTLENFYDCNTSKDGLSHNCKQCISIKFKNYYLLNKDRISKQHKSRSEYKRNRDYIIRYNITLKEYNEMLKLQDYKCKICKSITPGGKGNFKIDHCHSTGKVRGLLCNSCNVTLGLVNDDITRLKKLINYLIKK